MHDVRQKATIPYYSLSQISENKNDLFEIREVKITAPRRDPNLYLPHRKDYYFFFLVKKGNHHAWIDFVGHAVKPGHLYFTTPGQVHLKAEVAPVTGTLVAFTKEFLLTDQSFSSLQLPILENPAGLYSLPLSSSDITLLDTLHHHMLGEFHQDHSWKNGMLRSWLEIFLLTLSRLYTEKYQSPGPSPAAINLVRKMKKLVDKNYHTLHQASDYARLLHVTTGHLNDTIREHLGRTATTLIHDRIILEAKRALFHTNAPIREIGYSLNFEDPAYFGRFFKRLTGQTPAACRNHFREKCQ